MLAYRRLLTRTLAYGTDRPDRTGVGTRSLFGCGLQPIDLVRTFPLLTLRKINPHVAVTEALWMLRGSSSTEFLHEHGVHIWDPWADEDGNLGPVYGAQWRAWRRPDGTVVDQLRDLIDQLRINPASRRHLLVAYNVGELQDMALPPCPFAVQFYVRNSTLLDAHVSWRSVDLMVGLPFDLVVYGVITALIAAAVGLTPGRLSCSFGDAHIYLNHLEQARVLCLREPLPPATLAVAPRLAPWGATHADIRFINYQAHPGMKMEVAV